MPTADDVLLFVGARNIGRNTTSALHPTTAHPPRGSTGPYSPDSKSSPSNRFACTNPHPANIGFVLSPCATQPTTDFLPRRKAVGHFSLIENEISVMLSKHTLERYQLRAFSGVPQFAWYGSSSACSRLYGAVTCERNVWRESDLFGTV